MPIETVVANGIVALRRRSLGDTKRAEEDSPFSSRKSLREAKTTGMGADCPGASSILL